MNFFHPSSAVPMAPRSRQGMALVSVLLLIVLMAAILAIYTVITINETRTQAASHKSVQGFYAAEGGLNMRAELVRALFTGYNQPSGTSPSTSSPCTGTDLGSGNYACVTYPFTGRNVSTYVSYTGTSSGTVSTGTYSGLTYQQYAYDVHSLAYNSASSALESSLEMTFQSRLVPLFQFAAFYQKDLEFQPGANMTLSGRVATNGSLYLNANSGVTLTLNGIVSAAGNVYRSGKDGRSCNASTVYLQSTTYNVSCSVSSLTAAQLKSAYGGYLLESQPSLTVPTMSSLAPVAGNNLWDQADIRVVVKRTAASTYTYVAENADGSTNATATTALNASGALSMVTFADYRENADIAVLQVDQQKLMNSIVTSAAYTNPSGSTLTVDDTTGGGLVWNFSFDDSAYSSTSAYTNDTSDTLCAPSSNTSYTSAQLASSCKRQYAVGITNAAVLGPSSTVSSKSIAGLSIVTNQPIYLQGDFNITSKKPAAVMADAINVLSTTIAKLQAANSTYSAYSSAKDASAYASSSTASTVNSSAGTTVNAAFLSGIDDSVAGDTSQYNGGLQNYIRLHENWGTLTYNGSFVSLGNSKHVGGLQSSSRYSAPTRVWAYDTDFNTAANLPPLTPRLVYLRQLLFARNYN